jgi:hypothetical protein
MVIHYSRCAAGTAIVGGHKAIASALVEQKERGPPGACNVAEERSKRSRSSRGPVEVRIVGVPVIEMLVS